MAAALEGGEWSAARPCGRTLSPGKTWYPFYRRLGGTQGRSGRAENLVPTAIFFRKTVSLLVLICYRVNRLTHCSLLVSLYDNLHSVTASLGETLRGWGGCLLSKDVRWHTDHLRIRL